VILLQLNSLLDDLTVAEPLSGDLIVVFLMTLLLEYFGECTIRVTVLLEYLDCASFLNTVCLIEVETLPFSNIQKTILRSYQGWVKICISAFSNLIHF